MNWFKEYEQLSDYPLSLQGALSKDYYLFHQQTFTGEELQLLSVDTSIPLNVLIFADGRKTAHIPVDRGIANIPYRIRVQRYAAVFVSAHERAADDEVKKAVYTLNYQ